MRILVTGSRDWDDEHLVFKALDTYAKPLGGDPLDEVVIVHGACPTGADAMAQRWAELRGIKTEPHPADWGKYHRAAGPRRNQEMVDSGADYCIAFPMPNSRGTKDCAGKAYKAGIPLFVYGPHADELARSL